ncbi:MAG: hypothetical protein AAGU26_10365 [bacterium]
MRIYYWPDIPNLHIKPSPSADGFIKFLGKRNVKIYSLVNKTLKKLEEEGNNLDSLANGWIKRLSNTPLSELRIPPHNKSGVIRLYYCTERRFPDSIIILDWQFKNNDKEKANTTLAKKRYGELKDAR